MMRTTQFELFDIDTPASMDRNQELLTPTRYDLHQPKPDSFFFIHCPKTGTSLFTVLRNSLDACIHKNFTCFGVYGGGYWGKQVKGNKDVYPYDAEVMFGPNITSQEKKNINICNGALQNCEETAPGLYHCNYKRCGSRKNKVTMIRNPYKWFTSYANWMWPYLAFDGKSIQTILPFESQISFTTGTNNIEEAIYILQYDYIWWGISDYWDVSICTFHCKFGGTAVDSEMQNSRSANVQNQMSLKTREDFSSKLPLLEDIITNETQYVDEHYKNDMIFYAKLLVLFWERAEWCECSQVEKK